MLEADTYNFGTTKVCAPEAVNEFGALGLELLLLVGVDDVSQAALNLVIMVRTLIDKTLQTLPGKVDLVPTNGVPRRLWGKIC